MEKDKVKNNRSKHNTNIIYSLSVEFEFVELEFIEILCSGT
jgi:hypothetical protein